MKGQNSCQKERYDDLAGKLFFYSQSCFQRNVMAANQGETDNDGNKQ